MTAEERINALIERAGSPVMIVKNNEQYSASARMAYIEAKARVMARETYSPKYECTISIMGDEIIAQDAKIRDMANTIDRMEAELHNVIGERDQLLADLNRMTNKHGSCDYCLHKNKSDVECRGCTRENDHWTWRGVPDKEE